MAAERLTLAQIPFKLDTTFYEGYVLHPKERSKWWKLWEYEKWERVRQLGVGGFGVVWLERESTTRELRAVKRLQLEQLLAQKIDIKRELQTLIALRDVSDLSATRNAV